jgi:hypothetical protein
MGGAVWGKFCWNHGVAPFASRLELEMYWNTRFFFIMCAAFFLGGCGGGGGGGGTAGAITSTQTFQVQAALATMFTAQSTLSFTVSGTVNGVNVTGSGTVTRGSVTGTTFEGASALQRSTTVSMTLTGNGQTIPLTSTDVSYATSNYIPLGSSGAEYEVVVGTPTIPATAMVNDNGTAYVSSLYTNSSKGTFLGTDTVTYVLLPDTASTALLRMTQTSKNTSNAVTLQDTVTVRVTPAGGVTFIDETVFDVASGSNLTITYQ